MPEPPEALRELLGELRALLPKIKRARTHRELQSVGQALNGIIERREALCRP